MRSYDKDSIYICYIENYSKYKNRKYDLKKGFVHNKKYFSTFLKINRNSFFDLSTGEYYVEGEEPKINVVHRLNIKTDKDNISEKKIIKESKKLFIRYSN